MYKRQSGCTVLLRTVQLRTGRWCTVRLRIVQRPTGWQVYRVAAYWVPGVLGVCVPCGGLLGGRCTWWQVGLCGRQGAASAKLADRVAVAGVGAGPKPSGAGIRAERLTKSALA